jgi:hypothetical protein
MSVKFRTHASMANLMKVTIAFTEEYYLGRLPIIAALIESFQLTASRRKM